MKIKTIQPFNRSTIQHVKAAAFTLAETLIVIGIIGVVAALTLPNLNHATGDKEKVTRVKKIYSALTDAVDRAQAIYGPSSEWFPGMDPSNSEKDRVIMSERFAKRVTEFMKVSKDCGQYEGCWSKGQFSYIDNRYGDSNYYTWAKQQGAYMVNLSDGMSLAFICMSSCKIKVDIDGPNKGKTQYGNDIFDFNMRVMEGNGEVCSELNQLTTDCAQGPSDSYGVTAWVIQNDNLDYLKATRGDDGDWECPNGKVLDWTSNTSCN